MDRPDYFHNKPEVNINLLFNMIQACRVELSIMKYKSEYKDTKDTELVSSAVALANEAKEVFDYMGKGGGYRYEKMNSTRTLEELKIEANKLGYSLCKQITYEKLSTCKCGSRRIASDIGCHRTKYYRCTNCGLKGQPAKTKYQAIINWNNAVKEK